MGSSTEMSSDLPMPVYTPTHIQTQSSHIDPAGSVVEPGLTVADKVQLISASAPCSFCACHVGFSYASTPGPLHILCSKCSPLRCPHIISFAHTLPVPRALS